MMLFLNILKVLSGNTISLSQYTGGMSFVQLAPLYFKIKK